MGETKKTRSKPQSPLYNLIGKNESKFTNIYFSFFLDRLYSFKVDKVLLI